MKTCLKKQMKNPALQQHWYPNTYVKIDSHYLNCPSTGRFWIRKLHISKHLAATGNQSVLKNWPVMSVLLRTALLQFSMIAIKLSVISSHLGQKNTMKYFLGQLRLLLVLREVITTMVVIAQGNCQCFSPTSHLIVLFFLNSNCSFKLYLF